MFLTVPSVLVTPTFINNCSLIFIGSIFVSITFSKRVILTDSFSKTGGSSFPATDPASESAFVKELSSPVITPNKPPVPASSKFLKTCRKLCDKHGALLIYDEVMSGFRASLRGASGVVSTVPDIVTFGKVIGAGMPVGAFASRSEIMDQLSPNGAIYQAGTLSGNPVAMAAGLKSLQKLKADKKIYKRLNKKAVRLTKGLKKVAKNNNIPLQVDTRGSMFGFFFCDAMPTNMKEVGACDFDRFAKFHNEMLKKGFYFACSQYETGFICDSMTNADIDATIKAAAKVMAKL